jgi:outer membrane protein assembly factor BamE (lipoprotein component of BamABCDE complex)
MHARQPATHQQGRYPRAWQALALLILAALLLAGCETVKERIEKNQAYFGSLPPAHQAVIRSGQIKVGFTEKEVYLAWGTPDHKAITESISGHKETWIYTHIKSYTYFVTVRHYHKKTDSWSYHDEPRHYYREFLDREVVFENGRVIAWTHFPGSMPYSDYPHY